MPLDDRINLHKLKVFALVVELGSVTKAADRLFVVQPVVTAHIRSLEERVGTKLFYREGRSLHLTESGQRVHAWAVDVLRRTHELSRHLDGLVDGSQGSIAFGASMTLGSYSLPPLLGRYRQERPQVDIRLNILDPEHVIRDTESGENDFSLLLVQVDRGATGLAIEKIGSEDLVLVAPPDSDPAESSITPEQLGELSFVDAQHGSLRRRLNDIVLLELEIKERDIAIELGHPEAMKRAVIAGLGVTMLYRSSVADELEAGILRTVEIAGADALMQSPVNLLWRKDKQFSAAQLDLLAEIRAHFSRSIAEPNQAA